MQIGVIHHKACAQNLCSCLLPPIPWYVTDYHQYRLLLYEVIVYTGIMYPIFFSSYENTDFHLRISLVPFSPYDAIWWMIILLLPFWGVISHMIFKKFLGVCSFCSFTCQLSWLGQKIAKCTLRFSSQAATC